MCRPDCSAQLKTRSGLFVMTGDSQRNVLGYPYQQPLETIQQPRRWFSCHCFVFWSFVYFRNELLLPGDQIPVMCTGRRQGARLNLGAVLCTTLCIQMDGPLHCSTRPENHSCVQIQKLAPIHTVAVASYRSQLLIILCLQRPCEGH